MRIASVGLDAAESEVGHAVAATFPQGLFMVYVLAGDCGRAEFLHHSPAGFVPSGSLCDLFRLALVFGVMLRVVSFCCPGHVYSFGPIVFQGYICFNSSGVKRERNSVFRDSLSPKLFRYCLKASCPCSESSFRNSAS